MILEIFAILLYGLGDLWTTWEILKRPHGKEINPIGNLVLKKFGFKGLIFLKIFVILTFISLWSDYIVILVILGLFVTMYNITITRKYDMAVVKYKSKHLNQKYTIR